MFEPTRTTGHPVLCIDGGEGWKVPRVPAAAPVKFYMRLVVTGQVP